MRRTVAILILMKHTGLGGWEEKTSQSCFYPPLVLAPSSWLLKSRHPHKSQNERSLWKGPCMGASANTQVRFGFAVVQKAINSVLSFSCVYVCFTHSLIHSFKNIYQALLPWVFAQAVEWQTVPICLRLSQCKHTTMRDAENPLVPDKSGWPAV